ncbi:uncharacterized protein LOC115621009 [Scaptodrosophila lebanonensis]|uniref:Uncharacterized protein LOC115621009 n=1 Tax=Drosophila lebanonensis TaxID=7225 RepID=A0A6J2T5J0_DROLE|nr:uncharacterized protein LOC115621009 [Scaptodrosophila lebanonensis]
MTGQERTIDMESNTNFQTLLDLFGTWENETFYDTRRIMKMLAPECKHLILKCSLANVNIPCFSKLAFQESLNPWGPCCTFNTKNSLKKRHFKNRLASSELGLTVVLNSSQDDYFTPVLNTNGYIVIVHDSENYASVASSNAVEVHPGQNEESFLMIYARVVETDPSLDSFSAMNRRCYFDNEAPNPEQLLASIYTFPNCITRCRIRSMVALCRCLPFYMPWRLVENQDGVVYCTLNHIPCLRQYNFKWTNVLIERKAVPGLEREMEEALYCPQCLPSCNDVQYSVSLHSLPIDNYLVTFANKSESNSDISLLRVYFGDPYAHLYIRLLNNAWFEVFTTKPPPRLVVGRAAWWIPAPVPSLDGGDETGSTEEEDTQKLSFAAELKDLLHNLSFHCYGKLVEQGRRISERFFWLIFHTTALSVLIAFLCDTYTSEKKALVTTLYDPLYPIRNVEFPTVSVCTINRISSRAVVRYAQDLSDKDPSHRNVSYFIEELRAFGFLYYRLDKMDDYERALRFQGFLDTYDVEPQDLFFNTRSRMHALTPNCSETFVSCRLAGEPFNCLKHFKEMLTGNGFCCTFNFEFGYTKKSRFRRGFFGAELGLVLTLKSAPSDNFFKLYSPDGFLHNYPDYFSGGVADRFAPLGHTTLLPIRPKIFETVPEARCMNPEVRNCLFKDEMPRMFKKTYSFSKCISICRARSVLSLCECVPFNVPQNYFGGVMGRVYCTLQHVECIQRYEFKWLNVITRHADVPGLEHEMEDALYCPGCLPSCTETRYKVRGAMMLALSSSYKPMGYIDGNNVYDHGNGNGNDSSTGNGNGGGDGNGTELAVVRIYFAQTHIQYFRQIIKNAWYETFSTIGNICSIIAGFSLIGICELLFFLAKQLWHACKTELKAECHHVSTNGFRRARQQEQQQPEKMELLILP